MITTGIYFRVERDGKVHNLLFEDMTVDERKLALKNKDHSYIVQLASMLASIISDINKQLA